MPKAYHFSEEQKAELETARKSNKNKNIDRRLRALLLRAENEKRKKVSEKTGFSQVHITELTKLYHNEGLCAITGNHYKGNHRNMSYAEEEEILQEFREMAEKGQIVMMDDIRLRYEGRLGRSLENSRGQIYRVLERHDFRKVMPRSEHPQKASPEAIEASKKST